MSFRVRVLRRAGRDMIEIQAYVARDSPRNAAALVDAPLDAIDGLSELPERGALPADSVLRARGYRFLVVRPYLVFYKIKGREVRVHRVLHGRRAYSDLL